MILWIASYPKSGNTWLRALITTYLYSDNGEFNFDLLDKIPKFTQNKYFETFVDLKNLKTEPLKISEYWSSAQLKINLNNEVNFFKTHNACASYKDRWFTDEKNTMGYIYVVRDPRAVACSNANHSNLTIEDSVNDLLNENLIGFNGDYNLAELPSSWKINYLSWKKKKKFDGIIIKYEDLIDNTKLELKKILLFLQKNMNIPINEEKISKTINSCIFSNLSQLEDKYGFKEAEKNKFFWKGAKDSWKIDLNQDLRKKIEISFKDEMIELGYLKK